MFTETRPVVEKTVEEIREDVVIEPLAVHRSDLVGGLLTKATTEETLVAKAEMERLLEIFRRPANQD